MYKNVALIPVRGGSKSIKNKNIKNINGKPLVYWSIKAALDSKYISNVFVSTDSKLIKDTINSFNLNVEVINRSPELSTDYASTESVMLDFSRRYKFDNIVLIQATSPLIKGNDIDKGFKKMEYKKEIDSILSVVEQKRFIWNQNDKGYYSPINYDYKNRKMRQDLSGYLVENGAFYITSRKKLLESGSRVSGNIDVVIMDEDSYYEIDEEIDWIIVEKLLENKKNNINKKESFGNIKLVLTDSDGVLTDSGMYYTENGDEIKKFNTKDGMGVALLKRLDIKTIIITGEDVKLVKNRAEKIGIDELYMGVKDKKSIIYNISKNHNIPLENIAYIGDDINDLEALEIVGYGFCVRDANYIVKEKADYILNSNGGEGALREVVDLIYKSIE